MLLVPISWALAICLHYDSPVCFQHQPVANSSEEYNDINITVGLMHTSDFNDLQVGLS